MVLTALSVLASNSFYPATWTGLWSPLPFLVAVKWGNRGSQVLTAAQAVWAHTYDCIKNCRDSEGNPRDNRECGNAVLQASFGVGLVVFGCQKVATWEKEDT